MGGVILYIMLSGTCPWSFELCIKDLYIKVLRYEVDFRGKSWIGVSEDNKDFVRAMLTVNPSNRLNAYKQLKGPPINMSTENRKVNLKQDVHKVTIQGMPRLFLNQNE